MRAAIVLIMLTLVGCSRSDKRALDSPTSGSIRIAVDESLRPLMEAEVAAFTGIYHKTSISVDYVPEAQAVQMLINDSVRVAVIARDLATEETTSIKAQTITPGSSRIALEGIALIVNKRNVDTLWTRAHLKGILGGGTPKWRTGREVEIVFDNKNSGIVRYVRDSILDGSLLPAKSYAVQTNKEVIDYVNTHEGAVGLIGASWISDNDDSVSNRFLETIRVVAIENNGDFYKPYQGYIANGNYPFVRRVVMCSREARSGLGTGFMAFVAGDKGQRVVLKAGLVPATMPIRLVEINHEPL